MVPVTVLWFHNKFCISPDYLGQIISKIYFDLALTTTGYARLVGLNLRVFSNSADNFVARAIALICGRSDPLFLVRPMVINCSIVCAQLGIVLTIECYRKLLHLYCCHMSWLCVSGTAAFVYVLFMSIEQFLILLLTEAGNNNLCR